MKKDMLEGRLTSIESTLHNMDKTLAVNTEHLADHMRRTALIEEELKPVVKHVEQMRGAAKLLGLLALIATIASLFMYFK